MTSSPSWYEVVADDSPLTQGDILLDCPVLTWNGSPAPTNGGVAGGPKLEELAVAYREDLVVMTQSCDLEHGKVANVVLCSHTPLSRFREVWERWMRERQQTPSEKACKRTCEDVAGGYVWNQTFLARSDHPGCPSEVRVVDFHDVFTIPRTFLDSFLARRRGKRLRLSPPYREHLSQAFARFFMRVGLPQPVDLGPPPGPPTGA